jgi:GNAT superfamily N-acetyltransferase
MIEIRPATPGRWPDLETLFGPKGAYAGCWCMFWRMERSQFKLQKGEGTKAELHHHVQTGPPPGLLAYVDGTAAGWCSLGPREGFKALENSRILKRVDNAPVWSIACFFVAKAYRGQGIMENLLRGAVTYAAANSATALEGYPLDLDHPQLAGQKLTSYAGYMGVASAYRAVGFTEVGRASETQLIMRYQIPPAISPSPFEGEG